MFDVYNVFANGGEYKGYKGMVYLGQIIVKDDEKATDVALDTYKELEVEDIIVKFDRKLSYNKTFLDKYTDKYYLKIFYDNIDFDFIYDDGIVKFALFHKRYDLPNNVDFTTDDYYGWEDMENGIEKDYNPVVIEPISMTDHSGLSIYSGRAAGWDSGQIGYIYITEEDMKKENLTKEQCENIVKNNISALSDYVSGNVYSVSIYDIENKPGREIEDIDVIGPFYGADFDNNGLYEIVQEYVDDKLDIEKIKSV